MKVAQAGSPSPASFRAPALESASRLDDVGVYYGTELSSRQRDCLCGWEPFLAPFRDQEFDLLEIGVGAGASLRTWREWFPFARLTGLDARRISLDPPIDGCRIVQGKQTDIVLLHQLVREARFRVVIDDGSRRADDQIQTFLNLFPWLDEGSVYICAGLPEGAMAPGDDSDTSAGPAWFSHLGKALVAGGIGDRPQGDSARIDVVMRTASGVFLMRGCAIVTH